MDVEKLSPTGVNRYFTCPFAYKCKRLKKPKHTRVTRKTLRGRTIHRIINAYFTKVRKKEAIQPIRKGQIRDVLEDAWRQEYEPILFTSEGGKKLRENFIAFETKRFELWDTYVPDFTEKHMSAERDIKYVGRIDFYGGNTVIDWKTGTPKLDEATVREGMFYRFLLEENGYDVADVQFVFLQSNRVETIPLKKEWFWNQINEMRRRVEQDEFPKRKSRKCDTCPYFLSCKVCTPFRYTEKNVWRSGPYSQKVLYITVPQKIVPELEKEVTVAFKNGGGAIIADRKLAKSAGNTVVSVPKVFVDSIGLNEGGSLDEVLLFPRILDEEEKALLRQQVYGGRHGPSWQPSEWKDLSSTQNAKLTMVNGKAFFRKPNGEGKAIEPNEKFILITAPVDIDGEALDYCTEHTIPIIFFRRGQYQGEYTPHVRRYGKITVKQAAAFLNHETRIRLARQFVLGGAKNMLHTLRDYADRNTATNTEICAMKEFLGELQKKKSIEAVMNVEAQIRKHYYKGLEHLLPAAFNFSGRHYRPPRTPIDALISYGNVMLYGVIAKAILRLKLDPEISYLHTPAETRRPSLSCDIAEIFKPVIVDRIILDLTREEITPADFHEKEGIPMLDTDAKEVFTENFNHLLYDRQMIGMIRRECLKLRKDIQGKEAYQPFIYGG